MLSLFLAISVVLAQCSNIVINREWRELSTDQQTKFLNAIVCLRKLPSKLKVAATLPQPKTRWEDFVSAHSQAAAVMHNTAQFLPWHRVMLSLYNKALREECNYVDPLPYWDWSIDSEAPERSVIWNAFGTTGCVSAPVLGNLTASFPNEHCVSRRSNMLSRGSNFSPEQIGLILANTGYNEFRSALESNPHNLGHSIIGGDMGSTILSPNDPIFFLHHANIDRIWSKWQKQNPTLAVTYNGNATPRSTRNDATTRDIMNFFGLTRNIPVQQALDSKSGAINGLMCFDYSDSVTPIKAPVTLRKRDLSQSTSKYDTRTPSQQDRTNLWNIRPPMDLPLEFLKEWMYTDSQIIEIRQREEKIKRFTEFINKMPLEFQTSLNQLNQGQKNGWRSKTAAEAAADDVLIQTLVKAFQ